MLRRRVMMAIDKCFNGSLFHFDKSFSAVYKDEYGNVWNNDGSEVPTISTTQKKFGTASLSQNNKARLTINTKLPYQDFTIEAWIYPTATWDDYNWKRIFEIVGGGLFFANAISSDYWGNHLYWKPNGTNIYITAETMPRNSWHHVAIVYNYSTNKAKLYIDGTKQGSEQNVKWNSDKPEYITLGIGDKTTGSQAYVDEFRFSKGQVYTSNFTPSDRPFEK